VVVDYGVVEERDRLFKPGLLSVTMLDFSIRLASRSCLARSRGSCSDIDLPVACGSAVMALLLTLLVAEDVVPPLVAADFTFAGPVALFHRHVLF
jgi:hypothetical protein